MPAAVSAALSATPGATIRTDTDPSAWDAFVHASPDSSYVHLSGWRDVMSRAMGHVTHRYAMVDAHGAIVGVLPVTHVRSALFGKHAVSMPFLNYGGALGAPAVQRALAEHAVAEAQRAGISSILLRGRAPQALPWDPTLLKLTVMRPLPATPELLLKEFDAKLRSQVKRALKEGATVHHGPDELPAFCEVFRRHMRDLGTPVMPRRFFEEIVRTFPVEARVTTVRHEGVPIAGGFGFRWHDEFEITWASSLIAYKKMSPNMLLYWGVMEQCMAEGVQRFDFGRSNPDSGTHKFKKQWGGDDVPLHWYYPGRGSAALPQKEQGAFALATKLWKRLPLGVASALGPHIVRGVP